MKPEKVLVAMSGGVDSSVTVHLLKEQGYECSGVTMKLYQNSDIGLKEYKTCCSQKDIYDAAEAAYRMGIPYEVLDFIDAFKTNVMEKFISTYEDGRIPNPCIDCNRDMKFGRLLEYALSHGFDHVATGHYARIGTDPDTGRFILRKAADEKKDQSYVLYTLTQEQLSHVKFPMGEMRKADARALAESLGLKNADKHDSQDICFVPDGDYVAFIERYNGKKYPDGDILSPEGEVIGTHRGAIRYTRGQRRGLGLSSAQPLYVIEKDMEQNTITAGPQSGLYTNALRASQVNWLSVPRPDEGGLRVKAKTRYRQKEQEGTVYPEGEDGLRLIFDEPQRAITPGQAVVMYIGDMVAGGGTITETFDC